MYKIMIVDDEPLTVRSLKGMIESLDDQFQVIGTANDGKSGFEKIRDLKPDLVFMDINMPIYDGLEVIEKLKREKIETEIVILSGFQEFEYAKRAISLGVAEYMVKPLNPINLEIQLSKLKEKIGKKNKVQVVFSLERLLLSNEANVKIPDRFEKKERFILAKICFNSFNYIRNNQFSGKENKNEVTILEEAIWRNLHDSMEYWILNGKYNNEYILVAADNSMLWNRRMKQVFDEVNERLSFPHTVTFVIGTEPESWNELRKCFVNLEGVLYCNAIFGKSSWLTDMDKEKRVNDIPDFQQEYLEKLIQKGKVEGIKEQLQMLFEKCKKETITEAALIQLLRRLMSLVCNENLYEIDFLINSILITSNNYEDLSEKVMKSMMEYMHQRKSESGSGADYIIVKVSEYLDDHFQEKILIQDVADLFHLSYSHLCSQFKKVKHVSPNEYMIMKRMEKARDLLENDKELNIREIAELVGYSDPYYFSRTFKLYEKITPSECRKRKERNM